MFAWQYVSCITCHVRCIMFYVLCMMCNAHGSAIQRDHLSTPTTPTTPTVNCPPMAAPSHAPGKDHVGEKRKSTRAEHRPRTAPHRHITVHHNADLIMLRISNDSYLVLAREEGAAPLQNGVSIEAKVGRAAEEDDQNEDLHDGFDALVHIKLYTTHYTQHPARYTPRPV